MAATEHSIEADRRIAPLGARSGKSFPDLYSNMPSRFVTRGEAVSRSWPHYYEGQVCVNGHKSPRYVTGSQCIDCKRERRGLPTIGEVMKKGEATAPTDKSPFAWTDSNRAAFIEKYVDTGDIASARDTVGATPSQYFRELAGNPDFAGAIEKAEPLANRALEERATQMALKGNDKLLQKLLAAKMPEQYSERVRLDVKQEHTHKLDDRALNARLKHLLSKAFEDPYFIDLLPEAQVRVIGKQEGEDQ